MLSQYLETNTLQLIRLLTTLLDCQNISFSQLTKVTSLKSKTCRHLLGQLTKRLDGMVCIEINEQSQISCSLKERVSKNQCLHLIYRDSMVLSCLKFLIFNQEHQPFTVFSKNHFLSTASAYRVREKCRHFLKSVHLSIRANQVCGEEFRIRYLIALLQCQYGVSCYPIEEDDLDRITEFMTNSNPNIAKNFLSLMEDEFAFCHFLMMLTWKRQAFRPYLPYSAQFDHIKPLFIYPKIIHFSKEYLETSLPFSFDQLDYDYLFLVYCTNTNFFCGHLWNEKEREKVCQLVATKTDIAYLIPSFKAFLGSNLSTSLPFLEAMMTLFRKCLFNLQSLIPEEDDLEAFRHSPHSLLYHETEAIIKKWMIDRDDRGDIAPKHLSLLTHQIAYLIEAEMTPLSIIICATNQAHLHVTQSWLQKALPKAPIQLHTLNLIRQEMTPCHQKNPLLILADQKHLPYLKACYSSKEHRFLTFSFEHRDYYLPFIQSAIQEHVKKHYANHIKQLIPSDYTALELPTHNDVILDKR